MALRKGWRDEHACGVQEALVLAASAHGQSSKVGVYVGCMWAHEFVEVLPGLVGTPPPSCCLPRRILHSHFSRAMPHLGPFQDSADEQNVSSTGQNNVVCCMHCCRAYPAYHLQPAQATPSPSWWAGCPIPLGSRGLVFPPTQPALLLSWPHIWPTPVRTSSAQQSLAVILQVR
jgi:hypothetical protein